MLSKLDPYTVYIPESQLEDFELMTKGEYGGIGALIQKQGDYVIITEPYEGFPAQKAGLKAGDKIISIDGESAKGKNSSAVSEKLKGVPGTEMRLEVEAYGDTVTREVTIIMEKVKIPNIPYYGILGNNVGYINLMQFNQNAAAEVKKAYTDLKSNNKLSGIIIDIRNNGGGLLNEAVDIASMFVPKGTTVVTTKGKLSESVHAHKTRNSPVDTKIPVIILVNNNSASASEIVAGAMQDLDRGVIIGQRTFGKGLVQNIVPLPYNSKMKITVAKYYIPSGRCIQAIDYFNKNGNGRKHKIPDSLITAFKTNGGRTVYDGGGIEPDIKTEPLTLSKISSSLYSKMIIFDFAIDYYSKNKKSPNLKSFKISNKLYNSFLKFIADKDYDYTTACEQSLKKLKENAVKENYFDAMKEQFDSLEKSMCHNKDSDLTKYKEEIKNLIRIEILAKYYYEKGRIAASIKIDTDIKKAIELLNSKDQYSSLINPQTKN
jgi:carboxyl-terminal processing protease